MLSKTRAAKNLVFFNLLYSYTRYLTTGRTAMFIIIFFICIIPASLHPMFQKLQPEGKTILLAESSFQLSYEEKSAHARLYLSPYPEVTYSQVKSELRFFLPLAKNNFTDFRSYFVNCTTNDIIFVSNRVISIFTLTTHPLHLRYAQEIDRCHGVGDTLVHYFCPDACAYNSATQQLIVKSIIRHNDHFKSYLLIYNRDNAGNYNPAQAIADDKSADLCTLFSENMTFSLNYNGTLLWISHGDDQHLLYRLNPEQNNKYEYVAIKDPVALSCFCDTYWGERAQSLFSKISLNTLVGTEPQQVSRSKRSREISECDNDSASDGTIVHQAKKLNSFSPSGL